MPAVPFDYLVSALVTLFVVVEPIGIAPVFLAVTQQLPPQERRRVAVRACLIAAAILAGSATIGDWLLAVLGISLPAFRIAGGLLLFSIASEMVLGVRADVDCYSFIAADSAYGATRPNSFAGSIMSQGLTMPTFGCAREI